MRVYSRSAAALATLLLLLVALPTSGHAAEPIGRMEAQDLELLSLRSPTVFDAYYRFRDLYQTRHPYFYLQVDMVSGPDFTIPTLLGDRTATVQGAFMSIGTVPYMFNSTAGVRVGVDAFLAGLALSGNDEELKDLPREWNCGSVLVYGSLFDTKKGWTATIGSHIRSTPYTEVVNGQRVFSHPPDDTEEGQVERSALLLAGTVPTPWFGIDLGVVIAQEGFEMVSAQGRMLSTDVVRSFGPHLASYPQQENYQAGLHLDGLRIWDPWLSVSSEATMRYSTHSGTAFDHVYVKTRTVFFQDIPDRNQDFRTWDPKADTDFHLALNLHGSYVNLESGESPWGGGFLLEFLSVYLWGAEGTLSLGAGYNFYEDMLQLPMPNVLTGRAVLSFGI